MIFELKRRAYSVDVATHHTPGGLIVSVDSDSEVGGQSELLIFDFDLVVSKGSKQLCPPRFTVTWSHYEHRGALRGTPGSAYPQPGPNATELPSSAPGRPKLIELQASAPSPSPTRAEEHFATTPDCRPHAPAPSPTPTRAEHLSGLQIVRLSALARRRAPKRTTPAGVREEHCT